MRALQAAFALLRFLSALEAHMRIDRLSRVNVDFVFRAPASRSPNRKGALPRSLLSSSLARVSSPFASRECATDRACHRADFFNHLSLSPPFHDSIFEDLNRMRQFVRLLNSLLRLRSRVLESAEASRQSPVDRRIQPGWIHPFILQNEMRQGCPVVNVSNRCRRSIPRPLLVIDRERFTATGTKPEVFDGMTLFAGSGSCRGNCWKRKRRPWP